VQRLFLLISYRNSLPPEQQEPFKFYIRDQFDVAGQHFMAMEYFEPKSPTRLYYKFLAVDADHKPVYNFTLTNRRRRNQRCTAAGSDRQG
jgi:hypothetical protein